MEDFSFIRDFKNIQWKRTIGLNLLRSAIAGVVWFFIITVTDKAHGSALPMLFFPLVFSLFFLPFGIFASFLSKWGVPYVGWATVFFTFLVFVADPIMYILHRTIPRIVPVEKYKFLSLHLVIFVLNNPDIAANDEYNAPKEIDRAKVKELLSSRIRPDDNEDEAEVNFLKEEVVVNEAIRAGKTVGGPPKLEISNSIFNFYDLRAGSTITDTFTISNVGGGALSGSVKTDKKWLIVSQNKIDRTLKKRDITFYINTSGLAFGFKDTGTIEIRSNAGIERVSVTISVEAATIASLRREINIPAIAGLGVLGVAIAVTVLAWQMALKTEKEAKLAKSTIKLAKPIIKQEPLRQKESQTQESTQKLEEIETSTDSKTAQSTLTKKETEKSASQEAVNNCFDTVSPDRWKGEYYNNGNLSGRPSMIRDDGDGLLCFVQKRWNPDNINGIIANNISVRWTRTVYFDGTVHQFAVKSNEGFKLYVDDELKLDSWLNQSLATFTSPVKPSAGNHLVKVEYHIINGGAVFELSWQALSTTEQPTVQAPVTINISGEWEGRVGNKLAELSLVQDGNSLSGNIIYDPVTEYLSGEINSTQVVLKGTGFESRYDIGGKFSLDTFYGTIMNQDGDFIRGHFTDAAGRGGSWHVTKLKSSSHVAIQKSIPNNNLLSEEEVKAFIEKLMKLSNENDDEIMKYYADNVDYWDQGFVTKDFIRQKRIYRNREWPNREYRISSSITIIPGNTDNEKTAQYIVHSIFKNDRKTMETNTYCEKTLRKQENQILIIRDKGETRDQQIKDNRNQVRRRNDNVHEYNIGPFHGQWSSDLESLFSRKKK